MADENVQSSLDVAETEEQFSQSILPQHNPQHQPQDLQNETDETVNLTDMSTDISDYTNKENSLMEDGIDDRFNGIFYNVHHGDNRVTIMFSTWELFTRFMSSFRKEFAEHKSTYTTHVQGQKCYINIHKSENGLTVTGPGYRIWRETTFIRLATNLYRQYETDTNKHLVENRHSNVSAASQSSTPNSSRSRPGSEIPLSPVVAENASARKLESISEMQSDIKSQVSSLMELVISLQEQVNTLSAKLENKNATSNSNNSANSGVNSQSNDQSVIIESGTENTTPREGPINVDEPSIVPGQNSYSRAVKSSTVQQTNQVDKTTKQKDTTQQKSNEQATVLQTNDTSNAASTSHNSQGNNSQQNQPPPSCNRLTKTLMIGDSLLSGVNKKGLRNNVHCQPFPGATVDTIINKIDLFDLSKFGSIVIYVGGNDSPKIRDTEQFETQYRELITLIREKNSACKIYLCGSCPRGDAEVSIINKVINKLAEEYRLRYVDTYTPFYDKNEDLRTKFYGKRDWIHLSNSGMKRLLGTIHNVTAIVENFDTCVFPANTGRRFQGRRTSTDKDIHYASSRQQNSHDRGFRDAYASSYRSNVYSESERQTGYIRDRDYSPDYHASSTPVERCAKCGLTNHSTAECRHRRQLLCFECNMYGHKDSVCWNV